MAVTLAAVFCLLVSVALPLGLLLYFALRKKALVLPFLVGALCFLITQVFLRIPLLNWVLPQFAPYTLFSLTRPILYMLFISFTAGLFEEVGRYVCMRLFLKRQLTPPTGVAFALGHGGTEALLVLGINYIYLLFLQPALLHTLPAGTVLLAGAERILAMVCHLAFTLVVLWAAKQKSPAGLLLAVVLHTGVNFATIATLQLTASPLATEGVLAVLALLLLFCTTYFVKHKGGFAT